MKLSANSKLFHILYPIYLELKFHHQEFYTRHAIEFLDHIGPNTPLVKVLNIKSSLQTKSPTNLVMFSNVECLIIRDVCVRPDMALLHNFYGAKLTRLELTYRNHRNLA